MLVFREIGRPNLNNWQKPVKMMYERIDKSFKHFIDRIDVCRWETSWAVEPAGSFKARRQYVLSRVHAYAIRAPHLFIYVCSSIWHIVDFWKACI